jgi:hypothetical protein
MHVLLNVAFCSIGLSVLVVMPCNFCYYDSVAFEIWNCGTSSIASLFGFFVVVVGLLTKQALYLLSLTSNPLYSGKFLLVHYTFIVEALFF